MDKQSNSDLQPKSFFNMERIKNGLFTPDGEFQFKTASGNTYRYYTVSDFENVAASVHYYGLSHEPLENRLKALYGDINPIQITALDIKESRVNLFDVSRLKDPDDLPTQGVPTRGPIPPPCKILPFIDSSSMRNLYHNFNSITAMKNINEIIPNFHNFIWKGMAFQKMIHDVGNKYSLDFARLESPSNIIIPGSLSDDGIYIEFDPVQITEEGLYKINMKFTNKLDPASFIEMEHYQNFKP